MKKYELVTGGDAQSAVIDSDFAEPLSINVSTGFNEPIIGGTPKITFIARPAPPMLPMLKACALTSWLVMVWW